MPRVPPNIQSKQNTAEIKQENLEGIRYFRLLVAPEDGLDPPRLKLCQPERDASALLLGERFFTG